MSDSAVSMRSVAVDLGGRRVLGPIDLDVSRGEHVLVVGASGSGKTTLLRVIAGLQKPGAGTIEIFGKRANDGSRLLLAPNERRVGFLFQGGALWPHMSVRRTLEFVMRWRGVAKRERSKRVASLLETVELAGFEDRMPGTLSGGEAQRLSLARALAMEPELLLLDEPLGPLDAHLRAALIERLDEVERRLGLTTLHVTHDPREVERIADRVLHLVGGIALRNESELSA